MPTNAASANCCFAIQNLVLLGPPGAGKGTQAALLIGRLQVPHLSTGNLLREAVNLGTDIGRRVRSRMEAGRLIDDELVTQLVAERLARPDACRGFILDGYPRTTRQAIALHELLAANHREISLCIAIKLDENRIIERLTERAFVEGRADDQPNAIRVRLSLYQRSVNTLTDYYRSQRLLAEIDGAGTVQEVSQRIWAVVTSSRVAAASVV